MSHWIKLKSGDRIEGDDIWGKSNGGYPPPDIIDHTNSDVTLINEDLIGSTIDSLTLGNWAIYRFVSEVPKFRTAEDGRNLEPEL